MAVSIKFILTNLILIALPIGNLYWIIQTDLKKTECAVVDYIIDDENQVIKIKYESINGIQEWREFYLVKTNTGTLLFQNQLSFKDYMKLRESLMMGFKINCLEYVDRELIISGPFGDSITKFLDELPAKIGFSIFFVVLSALPAIMVILIHLI